MLTATLALAMTLAEVPSQPTGPGVATQRERVFIELRPGIGRYYPPQEGDPQIHFQWGAAVSAALRGRGMFKTQLGAYGEHVIEGWAGEPPQTDIIPNPVTSGRYENTVPVDYRGQYLRLGAQARIGAENSFAFGYIKVAPGYAARVVPLRCTVGSCKTQRAVDHGLNIGYGFGALFKPWRGLGIGVDLQIDSGFFPNGHARLAVWNHGVSGTLVLGWNF